MININHSVLKKIICFSFILNGIFLFVNGQEYETVLTSNPAIKEALLKQPELMNARIATTPDTLHLPLIDDFSYEDIYPSADYWTDRGVYINRSFGVNPKTVGVATFDGLNQFGNAYSSVATAIGSCDTLTSKPINLFDDGAGHLYVPADSINLSFYYQRKGLGDAPEPSDSLALQFYNPLTLQWVSKWKITGGADPNFVWVKISITDVSFLQNGFRFRFMSFGSKAGLADNFHLDYIALRAYDVSPIADNAFIYSSPPLLEHYSAMPWRHYASLSNFAQSNEIRQSVDLRLINNNGIGVYNDSVFTRFYDQYGSAIITDSNSISMTPNTSTLFNYTLNSQRYIDNTTNDSTTFDIVNYLKNNSDGNPANDTIHYYQNFYDYYAYDDGSAESAYNVNGAANAFIAVKYNVLKADTLRALQIFFTQSGIPAAGQPFRLAVWSVGTNGYPGTLLYQQGTFTPQFTGAINGFYNYKLNSIFTVPIGEIFVGVIQNIDFQYNFGLDKNINTGSKIFYNYTGSWVQSIAVGSLMLRPVFGESLTLGLSNLLSENNFTVYPVPANDELHISIPDQLRNKLNLTLSDIAGRVILSEKEVPSQFNVRSVSNGIYFVKLEDKASGEFVSKKIIISH